MSVWAEDELITVTKINQKSLTIASSAPTGTLATGQLWHDTTGGAGLKQYDGSSWGALVVSAGVTFTSGSAKLKYSTTMLWEEASATMAIRDTGNTTYNDLKLRALTASGNINIGANRLDTVGVVDFGGNAGLIIFNSGSSDAYYMKVNFTNAYGFTNGQIITAMAKPASTGLLGFVWTNDNGDHLLKLDVRDGTLTPLSKIVVGSFPNSVTNSGEAWLGRGADRSVGVATLQLGSGDGAYFEIVDYAWSKVLFKVLSNGNAYFKYTINTDLSVIAAQNLETQLGDVYISRTTTAWGYIVRPNSVGYKRLQFAVNGGSALEYVYANATYTLVGGSMTVGSSADPWVSTGISVPDSNQYFFSFYTNWGMYWDTDGLGTVGRDNTIGFLGNNIVRAWIGLNDGYAKFTGGVFVTGGSGWAGAATVTLALGDSDTGFNWVSDGVFSVYINGTETGRWQNGGLQFKGTMGAYSSTNGLLLYTSNGDYKIGFTNYDGSKGWIQYNVDSAASTHGHMFSAGSVAGTPTKLFYVRGDGFIGIAATGRFYLDMNSTNGTLGDTYFIENSADVIDAVAGAQVMLRLDKPNSVSVVQSGFRPWTDNTYTNGTSSFRWSNMYSLSYIMDNYLDAKVVSAPSDPSAGYGRLYMKATDGSNDDLYIKHKVNSVVTEEKISTKLPDPAQIMLYGGA